MDQQNSLDDSPLLSLVGVGPGDPTLLTVKAVERLEEAHVLLGPKARGSGESTAIRIVSSAVDISTKTVEELHFPMRHVRLKGEKPKEVMKAWKQAAERVLHHLGAGKNVAFPTLGDPALYSTAYYLLAMVRKTAVEMEMRIRTEIIPGITAMSSCSAIIEQPLALGDDLLAVVPAAFDDRRLRDILECNDAVVLMKVHNHMDRITRLIREAGLIEQSVLVERCSTTGEQIFNNLSEIEGKELHYFSTIIIRKSPIDQILKGQSGSAAQKVETG